jgi:hypothetical protein
MPGFRNLSRVSASKLGAVSPICRVIAVSHKLIDFGLRVRLIRCPPVGARHLASPAGFMEFIGRPLDDAEAAGLNRITAA